MTTTDLNTLRANRRHGGPFDRGSCDAYYGRSPRPHFFKGASYASPEITDLTGAQTAAYMAGYENEDDRKEWD